MISFVSDLISYLKAVFLDGIQIIFTLFDVLGLVIYFFPGLDVILTLDLLLTRRIGFGIIFISFLFANFALYRKSIKCRKFAFEELRVKSVNRVGDWLDFNDSNVSIAEQIVIDIEILVGISNLGSATSVRFFVDVLEPLCLSEQASFQDTPVRLTMPQVDQFQRASKLENPCRVNVDEMKTLRLTKRISFDFLCLEKEFGSLSAFTAMNIRLGAQPTGLNPIYQSITCDLSHIHETIEEKVASKIQHLQSSNISGVKALGVIKRYWRGNIEDNNAV